MNDRIQQVLTQMAALEDELRDALHEQETRMLFEIKGRRVEFEHTIKQAHRFIGTIPATAVSSTTARPPTMRPGSRHSGSPSAG